MANWFRKKDNAGEQEDFVLYNSDAGLAEDDSDAEVTRDLDEIQEKIKEKLGEEVDDLSKETLDNEPEIFEEEMQENESVDEVDEDATIVSEYALATEKKSFFDKIKDFCKEHKTLVLFTGIGVAVVAVLCVLIILLAVFLNPFRGYVQAEVQKGNVIPSITTSGVMAENDRYSITSLVAGKVVESVPALGDVVEEGDVLYELDDEKAQIAIKRAKNEVDKAKAISGNIDTTYKINSTVKGKVKDIKIKKGAAVKSGQVVATVEKEDKSVVSVTSTVSGTVESISATKGKEIASGGLIATVTNDKAVAEKKGAPYDQKSRQYDLDEAEANLEDYTIKAPVSGVIIEKNINVGDNVGVTNDENPMMVIMDMNSMKFTFTLDEYEIWDIELGQKAIITAEALPSDTFAGEVTRIGSEGKKNEEGKTVYEVDITIEEPGALKVGMKVNAKVILASATNVLTVPKQALMEADGKNALVLVKKSEDAQENTDEISDRDEELAFPWIEVPRGCKLVTVKYGINDGEEVEIISGLEQGDIVVFDPERVNNDLEATSTSTPIDIDAIEESEESKDDSDDKEEKTEKDSKDSVDNKDNKESKENKGEKSSEKPSAKPEKEDAITPKKDSKADNLSDEEARKIVDEKTMNM